MTEQVQDQLNSQQAANPYKVAIRTSTVSTDTPESVSPDLDLRIEALLMNADAPQPTSKLNELLNGVGTKAVKDAIKRLNQAYADTNRSFCMALCKAGLSHRC